MYVCMFTCLTFDKDVYIERVKNRHGVHIIVYVHIGVRVSRESKIGLNVFFIN